MEFKVLGPLCLTVAGRQVEITSSRQRTVLAMLLLERNRVVPTHRLVDALWDDDPPATARAQVQICISALRRMLSVPGRADLIRTGNHGYVLSVAASEIDLDGFHELVKIAKAQAGHQPDAAIERLRTGLALWRGEAFADVHSRLVRSAAARLDELRLATAEQCVELELSLGRNEEASLWLAGLIREHPLRERLRYLRMLALYRCGLQAEALAEFHDARRALVAELGLEPGPDLRRLQHAIIVADPKLTLPRPRSPVPASVAVPRQLPADIPDFTGRADLVARLTQGLGQARSPTGVGRRVYVITGRAGVGKTALAVRVAHEVARSFPDGQLFACLYGDDAQPLTAARVLERFHRALGVDGTAIPDSLDERTESFRSLVADRRMLIVLDSAAAEGQILPLLPATGGCAVIVTSRRRLTGLAGAVHSEVEVLDQDDSLALLSAQSGRVLQGSELIAARRLAAQCGGLPLAIRIAAARLASRPHWPVSDLVARLADAHHRLDELRHGELGVRSSISVTYNGLTEAAQRLFRMLGIIQVPDFAAWMVIPLLNLEDAAACLELLEQLVDARMVDVTDEPTGPRYGLHDLLLVYARERLAAEEPAAERTDAVHRLVGCLLHLTEEAHRRVYGGDFTLTHGPALRWRLHRNATDALLADPLRWLERERGTIVAGVGQAVQGGLHDHAWDLAMSAVVLFEHGPYFADWRESHELALACARSHGNRRGEAAMRYSLGALAVAEQRPAEALAHLEAAHQLFGELGLAHGTALVLRHLAFIDRIHGRLEEAIARYERALPVLRSVGDRVAEAHVLNGLGRANLELRSYPAAQRLLEEALTICRGIGTYRVAAQCTQGLGEVCLAQGDLAGAQRQFEAALWAVREVGDRVGEAYSLAGLGMVALRRGEVREAIAVLTSALDVSRATNERMVEARICLALGEAHVAGQRPTVAVGLLTDALATFRQLGAVRWQARSLTMIAAAHDAIGDRDAANQARQESAGLSSE